MIYFPQNGNPGKRQVFNFVNKAQFSISQDQIRQRGRRASKVDRCGRGEVRRAGGRGAGSEGDLGGRQGGDDHDQGRTLGKTSTLLANFDVMLVVKYCSYLEKLANDTRGTPQKCLLFLPSPSMPLFACLQTRTNSNKALPIFLYTQYGL